MSATDIPKSPTLGYLRFMRRSEKRSKRLLSHLLLFLLYRSEPPAQQVVEHVVRVREMSAGNLFTCFLCFRCLFAFSRLAKATFFGYFLVFRCLSSFLPALKATNFAGFLCFRCLFAFSRLGKATFFGYFLVFRCLFAFSHLGKATFLGIFLDFRCLFTFPHLGKAHQKSAKVTTSLSLSRLSNYDNSNF